jgi:hypothetical protein
MLKSIHYSLNASLSKRAGRPNFVVDFPPNRLRRANLMPDSESAQKNWTIETRLLLTLRPKTPIVGIVTGPLLPIK